MIRIFRLRFCVLGLFLICGSPPFAQAEIAPQTAILDNGLQIVVVSDHRLPTIIHMLWYRVGAANEPEGKSGVAHFFEHLMFKGTKTYEDGAFDKIMQALGGEHNAFTSQDFTVYHQKAHKSALPQLMALEADRMVNLELTLENIRTERDVVIAERAQRVDNRPSARLNEKMMQQLFGDHPYGDPVIGWPEEIEALNYDDAVEFYQNYYAPNFATLVVLGDVTLQEVVRLAEASYGKIPASPAPEPKIPTVDIPIQKSDEPLIEQADFGRPLVQRIYALPQWTPETAEDFAALDMAVYILTNEVTGRLVQRLIRDENLAHELYGYSQDGLQSYGLSKFYIEAQAQGTQEKIIAILDEEIARLIEEGVTDDELAAARANLLTQEILSQDSQQDVIYQIGYLAGHNIPFTQRQKWLDLIGNMTGAKIQRAAVQYWGKTYAVTGIVRKEKTWFDQLLSLF